MLFFIPNHLFIFIIHLILQNKNHCCCVFGTEPVALAVLLEVGVCGVAVACADGCGTCALTDCEAGGAGGWSMFVPDNQQLDATFIQYALPGTRLAE